MPTSRKSERPKPKRIPSFGESVRIFSRTLSQVPSNIRNTVRRVVRKEYRYDKPNDLLGFHKIIDFMYLDPSDINPNILKKGTGDLSDKQQKGINILFKIKEIAERHPPEEKEATIRRLKNNVRQRLDPNSDENREEDEVIKYILSKGGNRRTRNRRTRRRM